MDLNLINIINIIFLELYVVELNYNINYTNVLIEEILTYCINLLNNNNNN